MQDTTQHQKTYHFGNELLLKIQLKENAEPNIVVGAAAITLHGRSRQQRYTKNADWEYISECAALIQSYNQKGDDLSDTVRESDERSQSGGKVYFLGNGDCYSHADYRTHIEEAKVNSVMIARGALIKPVRIILKYLLSLRKLGMGSIFGE